MTGRPSDELKPLMLGTEVKPYGKIGAIGSIQGERYYWFENDDGSVAMMPATIVEKGATHDN